MILLAAGIDPNLSKFFLIGAVIFGLCLVLRFFRQPYAVAYILAGVMLGEDGFQLLTDKAIISSMGEFGLILLLFFIGMEISLPDLLKNWKVPAFGTLLQIGGSILATLSIGQVLGWEWNRIIVLGFVISLSSSAVVIKILQDNVESQTLVGKNVISILLMQDILIVPMLIISGYLGGHVPAAQEIFRQLAGGIFIIGILLWIVKKQQIELPYTRAIEKDHELQVFVAFLICFGCALLTALLGLSAALGAFVGGLIVHAAQSTTWFHDSLHGFRVILVAVFFISVGMLIDLDFLIENWMTVLYLLSVLFLTNHLINSLILSYFGNNRQDSLYGGSLLAQVGELSFILAALAFSNQINSDYEYQLTIIIVALSILISPFWIGLTKLIVNKKHSIQKIVGKEEKKVIY